MIFNDTLNTFYLWLYAVDHNGQGRRKEMFYLMMDSAHFILWQYGVRHTVKDMKRGNPLPPLHWLVFSH